MDESYGIRKGRKVGIRTPVSYFTGTITGWNDEGKDIFLGDVEETLYHFLPDREEPIEYMVKRKKVRIPEEKINHYEFLD